MVVKGILIIADGLGGRPTDIAGETCLEAAATPNLDRLAERGAIGLVDPIGPGIRPGSDTAHLSLLGYDPYEVYTGRGVFECLGVGLDVQEGDVCFRANFASVEEVDGKLRVTDRRAGRIETGQEELEAALSEIELTDIAGVKACFRASTEHRGALLLRGEGLSPRISETDPHRTGELVSRSAPLAPGDPAAERTATAVNELTRKSYEVLKDLEVNRRRIAAGNLPANVVLLRGSSQLPHLEPLSSIYGVRGAVIAGGALYRGIALACGMEVIRVEGATGGLDTDLSGKAAAALAALERFDYVFVHVKGPDNAGHDGDAHAKRAFIERVDRELIGPLVGPVEEGRIHLAFTGDHTTPPEFGDHTDEPVPVLFAGRNVIPDQARRFGERAAGGGGLGRFSGRVLPILLGYCDWGPKFGS